MIAPTQTAAIRGIVLNHDRDTIVIQATPDEVATFAGRERGREVRVQPDVRIRFRTGPRTVVPGHPHPYDATYRPGGEPPPVVSVPIVEVGVIDPEDYLFDRAGRPVCTIRSLTIEHDALDVTAWGGDRQTVLGLRHVTVEVDVLHGVEPAPHGRR